MVKVGYYSVICFIAIVTSSFLAFSLKNSHANLLTPEMATKYTQWKLKYGKLYSTPEEQLYRQKLFVEEYNKVELFNKEYELNLIKADLPPLSSPMFELNHFGDLTSEEFEMKYTGAKFPTYVEDNSFDPSDLEIPATIGQQEPQYIPRLRDQQTCGGCWAFAVAAVAEKVYFNLYKSQVDISHQELIDCERSNEGCLGGDTSTGLDYINKYSITTSDQYPYISATGVCQSKGKPKLNLQNKLDVRSTLFSMDKVQTFIKQKNLVPVVSVRASERFKYLSKSDDIFDAKIVNREQECENYTNHMISIIDINRELGYLHLLNSWGDKWANKGYKKMKPCDPQILWGTASIIFTA